MLEQMETVRVAMLAQANAVVSKHGVDPEAVFAWARENYRAELGEAVTRHAMQRTPAVYNDIAKAYIERLDTIDPGAILDADIGDGITRVHQDDKGNIVLTGTDGVTYSWKSAVRSGLVKLSR